MEQNGEMEPDEQMTQAQEQIEKMNQAPADPQVQPAPKPQVDEGGNPIY